MSTKTPFQFFLAVTGTAFILNLIWEIGQMPWYVSNSSLWQHLPLCVLAAIGDVVIILCLYGFVSLIQKDVWWLKQLTAYNIAILIITGGLVAIGLEQLALATNQWQYTPTMPLLPLLGVGLLPLLQMILLPTVSILIVWSLLKKEQ